MSFSDSLGTLPRKIFYLPKFMGQFCIPVVTFKFSFLGMTRTGRFLIIEVPRGSIFGREFLLLLTGEFWLRPEDNFCDPQSFLSICQFFNRVLNLDYVNNFIPYWRSKSPSFGFIRRVHFFLSRCPKPIPFAATNSLKFQSLFFLWSDITYSINQPVTLL